MRTDLAVTAVDRSMGQADTRVMHLTPVHVSPDAPTLLHPWYSDTEVLPAEELTQRGWDQVTSLSRMNVEDFISTVEEQYVPTGFVTPDLGPSFPGRWDGIRVILHALKSLGLSESESDTLVEPLVMELWKDETYLPPGMVGEFTAMAILTQFGEFEVCRELLEIAVFAVGLENEVN